MSKRVLGHPGEERLLRLADGELPPRESAEVREHLEVCWECRAEMEIIQAAVAGCVHYRKSVLQAHLPPPPSPWRDLTAGYREVDREIAGEASWWRLLWQAFAAPRFWVPAVAAGLVVTLVLIPWLRVTPSVQAAELLRRAVTAAEARPRAAAGARKLQVRTKTKNLLHSAASADLRPVARLFESARYDWSDPLSAKAYLDWHSRLNEKTDEVTPDGDRFYEVRTRSNEGELTEATLRLRQHDLVPVQGLFRFRGDEWVELTDAAPEPELAVVPKSSPAPVSPVIPPVAPPMATLADELRVIEALHRIGADLGDPIEVAREGAHVQVKGFGIDPRRRVQIEAALRILPAVNLSFVDESAPAGSSPGPGRALAVKPAASPLQALLERRLGSQAAIEQFTNEVFDRDERIMARAHAIQRLAARVTDSSDLGAEELALYRAMQRRHLAALQALERELADVLGPIVPAPAAQPDPAAADAQSLLQAARRLERSLSILLGAAPLAGGDATAGVPERIASEQAALQKITRLYLETMGQ